MTLLNELETVLKENRGREQSVVRDNVLKWLKKKKKSVDAYRELRNEYIRDRRLGDPIDMALPAPTTVEDLADSLADLASTKPRPPADRQSPTSAQGRSPLQPVSDAVHELSVLRREIVREIRAEIKEVVGSCIREAMAGFVARLEVAEEKITALQHENEAHRQKVQHLEERITSLDAKLEAQIEKAECERRERNLVIEGLPSSASGHSLDDRVHHLFQDVLGCAEKMSPPTGIIRLRSPRASSESATRIVVRLATTADKATVLRSCRALKDHPNIHIWEDLTPQQQKDRKRLLPEMKRLRSEGKRAWIRGGRLYMAENKDAVPKVVHQ